MPALGYTWNYTPRADCRRGQSAVEGGQIISTANRVRDRVVGVPRQGIVGVLLIAIWWTISWTQLRPLSDYYFFPLWLGYILTIDAIVEWRSGTSLWRRSRGRFALLFVASIPFWWFFEGLNVALQNWHYLTPEPYGPARYVLLSSIAFSTVVPAVLETTELLASFRVGQRLPQLPAWPIGGSGLVGFHLLGWVMVGLALAFPRYTFPLAWLCLFFLIEPINVAVGQRSIGHFVRYGQWAPVWNVMLATLCTGFFWEMWNIFSMPKWYYTVPFVGFAKVFEMPILGYSGYLPFGLEVFAIFGLTFWLVERHPQCYARAGDKPVAIAERQPARVKDAVPAD